MGLFLFAVYLLTYRGGFHSVDEVSMFAVTESLVKFGQFNTDQIAWTQWTTSQSEAQGFFGAGGHVYSKKGLALSLAQAPLYWLALIVPGLGMLQTVSLLNAIVTAATGTVLFAYARRLGFERRTALAGTLIFGLATIAWVYSKYLFSEPLAALLLLLAAYWLLGYRQQAQLWRPAGAGLAAGLAVLARANNLLLVPVFGLYLLAALATPPAGAPPRPSWLYFRLNWRQTIVPLLVFGLALAACGALLAWYNLVRAGSATETGYDLTLFSANVLLGLYKLLFSPLRGLFVYSPVLFLALPGWRALRRSRAGEAWLIAGLVGVTVALFSVWSSGEGLSWGSRFLVPVAPFAVIALLPVVARTLGAGAGRPGAGSAAVVALAGLSGLIQVLGVAINPWVFLARLQAGFGGEFFLEKTAALYDFRYSQIAGQLQNWSVQNSDLAWWQPGRFEGPVLLACLGLAAFIAAPRRVWPGSSRGRAGGTRRLPWSRPVLVTSLAAAVALFALWRYNQIDPQFGPPGDPYSRALATVEALAAPDDRVLSVAWRHYHLPMNRFKAARPIIGFARSVEPLPPSAGPLLAEAGRGENVWLITQGLSPADPDNPAEAWLAEHAFKAGDVWLADDAGLNFRLARYGALPPAVEQRWGATFGDLVELAAVRLAREIRAGQVLPVELTWQSRRPPARDLVVFLHLLAPDGSLAAQYDGPPAGGYRPATGWGPGEVVVDRRGVALPADLPPGEYRLIAGLYDAANGARLALDGGHDFVELGPVRVSAPAGGAPSGR